MAMARSNLLLRQSPTHISKCLRHFSGPATTEVHHRQPLQNHKFLDPSNYIGSWEAPKDPKEAQAKLALLRRQYAKQVKEVRKEYIREVELMRLEQQRKEEAKREAIRVAREERNKLKAAEAMVRAAERKVAEQEFHETLLKERAEKLENWRMKERKREEKNKEKRELLHRKSSLWIDEQEMEPKIHDAIVNSILL